MREGRYQPYFQARTSRTFVRPFFLFVMKKMSKNGKVSRNFSGPPNKSKKVVQKILRLLLQHSGADSISEKLMETVM